MSLRPVQPLANANLARVVYCCLLSEQTERALHLLDEYSSLEEKPTVQTYDAVIRYAWPT